MILREASFMGIRRGTLAPRQRLECIVRKSEPPCEPQDFLLAENFGEFDAEAGKEGGLEDRVVAVVGGRLLA